MSKILITGSEGQLGKCFQAIAREFPEYELIFASKSNFDITNLKSFKSFYNQKKFNGIINCAAYSNVTKAQMT